MLKHNIIAHRGLWKGTQEQNSLRALINALDQGFGFETDIRDSCGEIVVSHEPPTKANKLLLLKELVTGLLAVERPPGNLPVLALNIKSDGLSTQLCEQISDITRKYKIYFFDMAVPDMLSYEKEKLPILARISEVEKSIKQLIDISSGIWLDSFSAYEWITQEKLVEICKLKSPVIVVSPELHQRNDYERFWKHLKKFIDDHPDFATDIALCTDFPEKAFNFFGGLS